jgi:hypothetical protein
MKAFIERVFKSKKQKQKELLDEIVHTETKEQVTEAVVEAIIKEVKKEKHIDCECKECIDRIKNAK